VLNAFQDVEAHRGAPSVSSDLPSPREARGNAAASRVDEAIAQMARIIVERFDPERIILFGSHARGTAGPDSDVDRDRHPGPPQARRLSSRG
jgi:hypothetical protein